MFSRFVLPPSDRRPLSTNEVMSSNPAPPDQTCASNPAPVRRHYPRFAGQLILSCLFLALCAVSVAHAATAPCFVVNPANTYNGNGSNWDQAASSGAAGAFNAIPSTLVRGAVYYLGDGTYPNYRFNTAASGTTTIEIRKAQSYDNCIATGWNTATMGSAQAVFPWTKVGSIITISGSYLIINGNGNAPVGTIGCGDVYASPPESMASDPPNPSACGIKIDNSTCTSTSTDYCASGNGVISGGGTGITWESVEWRGSGINANEPYFWLSGEGDNLQTVTGSYLHDMGTTDWTYGFNNATFSYNYSWGGNDSSVNHGEALQDSGNDANMVIHHNVFRDWITNGILVFVDPSTGTHDNFKFYDNVDVCSTTGACRHNDGEIGCFNSTQTCTNMSIVNNLFIGNSTNCGITVTNPGSYTVENNIWYNCPNIGWSFAGSTVVENYNAFLNSGSPGACQGATPCEDFTNTSATNPFISLPTNLNLMADGPDWNNRLAMSAPFNMDMNGMPFETDRGAYQFTAGGAVAPIISWPTPAAISYGTALSSTQLDASATSQGTTVAGTFVYAPIAGTIPGAGSQNLVVAFTPSNLTDYTTADANVTLVVNQASQAITFTPPSSPVTFGVSPMALTATGGASGNPVAFSVLSGPGTVSGSTLTITGAGTVVVAVNQAGNSNYAAATQVTQSITVNPAALTSQTITFTRPSSPVVFGVSPITLSATGGASGNPVAFSVLSGPGSVSGSMLTITGVGTVLVAANQVGNANYSAAAQVTQSVVVNQASQATLFTLVQKCHPKSLTTNTCTFANDVTPGDLVIGGAVIDNTSVAYGVKDGAGNAFTLSANSPCSGGSLTTHAWLFYLLSSPGGAKTNKVVFSDTDQNYVDDTWAYEFRITGGTAAFDTDFKGCGSSTTNANPVASLKLSRSNELAYFVSYTTGGATTGVGAPWTLGTLTQLHQVDGYDTSASSSITTAITPEKQGWGIAMAMAIKVVPTN
jgi:hypothetical protein